MIRYLRYLAIILAALISACSVMPKALEIQAVALSFEELVGQGAAAIGQTAILGGYLLKVENFSDYTRVEAVQAPLSFNQKPKSKDLSRGRLILSYPGFLDPEVYGLDRKITFGGRILGSSATAPGEKPFPYLELRVESIHLWPVEPPIVYYEPDPLMYGPFERPFPWGPYPYRWR